MFKKIRVFTIWLESDKPVFAVVTVSADRQQCKEAGIRILAKYDRQTCPDGSFFCILSK